MVTFQAGYCYRMPVFFGGNLYQPVDLWYHDVTTMTLTYETNGDRLRELLPPGFELQRPELSIGFSQCREVDWMGGSGYNLIGVTVPVNFNGACDQVTGPLSLVVWENKTAPILGGREETGVAKVFADIADLHALGDYRYTVASHEGYTFLKLAMTLTAPLAESALAPLRNQPVNSMHWRYIAKVGGPGADISEPVLYPQRVETAVGWLGSGEVTWQVPRPEHNPLQTHIIAALAELPQNTAPAATLTRGKIVLTPSLAKVLS